jgi:hypothetical protein
MLEVVVERERMRQSSRSKHIPLADICMECEEIGGMDGLLRGLAEFGGLSDFHHSVVCWIGSVSIDVCRGLNDDAFVELCWLMIGQVRGTSGYWQLVGVLGEQTATFCPFVEVCFEIALAWQLGEESRVVKAAASALCWLCCDKRVLVRVCALDQVWLYGVLDADEREALLATFRVHAPGVERANLSALLRVLFAAGEVEAFGLLARAYPEWSLAAFAEAEVSAPLSWGMLSELFDGTPQKPRRQREVGRLVDRATLVRGLLQEEAGRYWRLHVLSCDLRARGAEALPDELVWVLVGLFESDLEWRERRELLNVTLAIVEVLAVGEARCFWGALPPPRLTSILESILNCLDAVGDAVASLWPQVAKLSVAVDGLAGAKGFGDALAAIRV